MLLVGKLEIFEDARCATALKRVLAVPFERDAVVFCALTKESALIALTNRMISTYRGVDVSTTCYRDVVSVTAYDVFLERGVNIDTISKREKIVLSKQELVTFAPYVERLSTLVGQAKSSLQERADTTRSPEELICALERLAALHAGGGLTDEEFRLAKAKLLAG